MQQSTDPKTNLPHFSVIMNKVFQCPNFSLYYSKNKPSFFNKPRKPHFIALIHTDFDSSIGPVSAIVEAVTTRPCRTDLGRDFEPCSVVVFVRKDEDLAVRSTARLNLEQSIIKRRRAWRLGLYFRRLNVIVGLIFSTKFGFPWVVSRVLRLEL